MDTNANSLPTVLGDSDNTDIPIRVGDKVKLIHNGKLKTVTVVRHSDGKVYAKWREVFIVRSYEQVIATKEG